MYVSGGLDANHLGFSGTMNSGLFVYYLYAGCYIFSLISYFANVDTVGVFIPQILLLARALCLYMQMGDTFVHCYINALS